MQRPHGLLHLLSLNDHRYNVCLYTHLIQTSIENKVIPFLWVAEIICVRLFGFPSYLLPHQDPALTLLDFAGLLSNCCLRYPHRPLSRYMPITSDYLQPVLVAIYTRRS